MIPILILVLQLIAPQLGGPPGRPADVDLPRPQATTYPAPPAPTRPTTTRAAPLRTLFWTQDSQSLATAQQYTFGLLVDKATTPVALAAVCQAQPVALVYGCSARFTPTKGTHTYTLQTSCAFCAPTFVRSQPVTLTY